MSNIVIPGIKDQLTIQQLHRIINRCDVVKDASVSPPTTSVANKGPGSVFGTAADALFGIKLGGRPFDGSKTILDSIKKTVLDGKFQGGALGGDPESIVSIKMSKALKNQLKRDLRTGDSEAGNLVEKSLPETYQYAFHDSGDTPGLIQTGIQQILTPGSYIDPAGRVKEGIRAPSAGSTDLTEYGFDGLKLSWKWLPGDKCQIGIKMGDIEHTETRTREHGHEGPPPDYFGGNNEKNAWFNKATIAEILDAKKYILCKELGDTTQATFAKYLYDQVGTGYMATNSCLFTLDTVLALRCKLLEIPCCAKDYGKGGSESGDEKFRRLLFYRPISDPAEITRTRNSLAITETIKHNSATKFAIANIFNAGFLIGKDLLEGAAINTYIRDYFRSIQDSIDDINAVLQGMLANPELVSRPEDEIRLLCAYMRINDLFKIKRKGAVVSYQLITTVRNIFPIGDQESVFYNVNVLTAVGSNRQNRSTNIFQGSLMGPAIDVATNFRDKIVVKGGRTIYDHISFLKSPPKDIVDRIRASVVDPTVGGWRYPTTPKPPKTPKHGGGGANANKFKQQYSYLYSDSHSKTTYFEYDYDPDTMDLLWLLYKKLSPDRTIMREYYSTGTTDENLTNYIEDFAFFIYPYFIYLGEACFDIDGLQWFHDTYYAGLEQPAKFEVVIQGYVNRILLPREAEMKRNREVVLPSNQTKFLRKFLRDAAIHNVPKTPLKPAPKSGPKPQQPPPQLPYKFHIGRVSPPKKKPAKKTVRKQKPKKSQTRKTSKRKTSLPTSESRDSKTRRSSSFDLSGNIKKMA